MSRIRRNRDEVGGRDLLSGELEERFLASDEERERRGEETW